MNSTNNIANDLFYKIRSRFQHLKLGNQQGEITIDPEEARFFDFDYVDNGNPLGHVSISLAEPSSVKVYFSTDITSKMDAKQKVSWYRFLREMRSFAKRRLMSFDTRDITKDNLDQRDYAFLSRHSKRTKKTSVGESMNTISESSMYGSKRFSYQRLLDTRLVVKHNSVLADSTQHGARSRNIKAIYVENSQGERFKYPFNHLSGARAMQRHVANGGVPYDKIGESIVQMSKDIAALKKFNTHAARNGLTEGSASSLVEKSHYAINQIRETVKKLSGQRFYENYKNSFNPSVNSDVDYDQFIEQYNLSEHTELADVVPVLYRIANENSVIEVGYNEVVSKLPSNQDAPVSSMPANDLEALESWIASLGEDSAITSNDAEERQQAIHELNAVIAEKLPAGVDGINAIESLSGIIDDTELFDTIKEKSKLDPEFDTRGLIKTWIEENEPEVVDKIDFGDFDTTDLETTKPSANKSEPAEKKETKESHEDSVDSSESKNVNLQELAEFIHSFYDVNTSTFPRGPEGVCIMVSKKYGRRAEEVARKLVSRMAPEQKDAVPDSSCSDQATLAAPVNAEISILKRLSGLA